MLPPDPRQSPRPGSRDDERERTGFAAASVNVGRLKEVLEQGLQAFDMAEIRARWCIDVEDWIAHTAFRWVQGCKDLHVAPARDSIVIELSTRDDSGFFEYGFSVIPGRRRNTDLEPTHDG